MNYPLLYGEHLSPQDLGALAQTAGLGTAELERLLRDRPGAIDDLLASPKLYDQIFGAEHQALAPGVSTFLAFGALVHRSARDLQAASHVPEWSGPGKRLPVFDVEPMRAFLGDGLCRFFLTEFLDSFTTVASGSYLVKTRTGRQRRRFSELDLGRMAEVVEMLPPLERPGGYRRLGDIALFMSGVFPDHAATHPLSPTQRRLVVESAGIKAADALVEDGGLRFFDTAGAGWYRRAADEVEHVNQGRSGFLRTLSEGFGQARRILNYMADRYLFKAHFD
ncbi:MAG TPA: hypothetical protein VJ938_07305 [Acidimicrobiia bacterium]|nr:hypothetical protein [Acidimicrobiia bacterium]